MRCIVVTGAPDWMPPRNSTGRAEPLGAHILFTPDKDEHLPKEYPRKYFSGYLMDYKDIQLLEPTYVNER